MYCVSNAGALYYKRDAVKYRNMKEVHNMCVVSINVPEEILLDLHENQNDFAEYTKKTLAMDLYQNKKVSLGYCASVAEMTKEEFVQYLGLNSVSIFDFSSEDEFQEELEHA
jgi:predicted HTH domain antitoxin